MVGLLVVRASRADLRIFLGASLALACSAGGAAPPLDSGGEPGSGGSRSTPGVPTARGGAPIIEVKPLPSVDPTDTRDVPVRKQVCVDDVCTCLRLALLGTLDSSALNKDTQPFTDWLNGNSEGTATVSRVTTKPTIDDKFLSNYDILLIANVNSWTFSAAEKAAVERWVRTDGGGIVALTGFTSMKGEAEASSQLIEFSGVRFQEPETAKQGQQVPVYYQGGTADLKNCLAWTGSSEAIITTPIHFEPLTDSLAKLTHALEYIGAFIGWSVVAPKGATVAATDPVSGSPIVVAHEVDSAGRILAIGDEWVIFANQWRPTGQPHNRQMDQYNPCWHPAVGDAPGFFHSVQTLYQTKQFWYDAINWVAPPNECNFVVKDPDVVPR